MFNKSIERKIISYPTFSRTGLNDILDITELLAVLLCIPLSYTLAVYFIDNINFPFYSIDYKLFILRYLNYYNYSWQFNLSQFLFFSVLVLISWYILSRLTLMAKLPRRNKYMTITIHFLRGNFFILLILMVSKFTFNLTSIPIIFIFTYVAVSMPVTLLIRLISTEKLKVYRARGNDLRLVMVIADDNYVNFIDNLISQKYWGYKIKAIISGSDGIRIKYGDHIPVWPDGHDIKNILDNNVIDEVIYCKKDADESEIHNLVEICNETGVIFRVQSSESTVDPMQISLKTVNHNGQSYTC
jgi:FlaA1/EpsC-like NDP-sugar epimerase